MTSLVFINPQIGSGQPSTIRSAPHGRYWKEMKCHAGATDGCYPVTTRELTKPYADHVENITVRKGDPFKRPETHQKSEKEQT
jgi:hypothetical protein